MATFPGGTWAPTTKVDAVDYVLASHINDIQNEIVALETYAFDKAIGPNLLYSTLSHDIWPGGTSFTATDDTYANLWNILGDGFSVTLTGVAGGSTDPYKRHLKYANTGTQYGGIVQFLSNADTVPLRGLPVSISADLWGTNITALRMAVIVWTSTADTLTSDVVGVWGAGNPTLATNWAYIGTPADITITTTRTRFSVANLTVPTNANNIALLIWQPGQEASGDFFNVARVKLEKGTVATEFSAFSYSQEQADQHQFMYVLDASSNVVAILRGAKATTTDVVMIGETPVTMRTTPTLTHNITAYTAGAPATTAIAVFDLGAGNFMTITGALTVSLGAANTRTFTILLAAGTSWSGTAGALSQLRVGPSVVTVLSARL